MKPLRNALLFAVMFMLVMASSMWAQEKQGQNTELLREKIAQLEKTDLNSKSSSVQDIFKRTLLRLYNQFSASLQQDLADLQNMQATLDGANSESQKEIADQIKKLTAERNETIEKTETLNGDLQTAASSNSSASKSSAVYSSLPVTPAKFAPSAQSRTVNTDVSIPNPEVTTVNNQNARSETVANLQATDAIPAQNGSASSQSSSSPKVKPPQFILSYLREGSTSVRGLATTHGAKVAIKINGQDVGTVVSDADNGFFIKPVPELKKDDIVEANELTSDGKDDASGPRIYVIREARVNPYHGGPVGLLVGGAVFSQQGDQFNQADPFMGFIAGYTSDTHGSLRDQRTDIQGHPIKRCTQKDVAQYGCIEGQFYRLGEDAFLKDSDGHLVKAGEVGFQMPSTWRWNIRFQGIFTADPRAAQSTEVASTSGTGSGSGSSGPNDSFKFIASRKSFDVEMHGWIDFWPLRSFSFGPYAAIGASTALSKNELMSEPTTVNNSNTSAGTGTGSGTGTTTGTTVVTSAESDNDIKRYYELGALSNIFMFNRKVFLQSILAYGRYEALQGLGKPEGHGFLTDSQNRFVGKLRIFPNGLATSFGKQIEAAPMFGVDLNAGRGPDNLKFFVGYAIKIQKVQGAGLQ